MITDYLKVTLRNLYREKLYTALNVFGLSIGIASCIVLTLYIVTELSYDRQYSNHQNIYRVVNEYTFSGNSEATALSSNGLAPLLHRDNPELVDSYVRFRSPSSGQEMLFRNGSNAYYWDKVYYADENAFDMFSHDIIWGNLDASLVDQQSIAVSESFARAYFGNENPLGAIVSTDVGQHRISLVFADQPFNTHFKYDVLMSMKHAGNLDVDSATLQRQLGSISVYTYVRLDENFTKQDIDLALERFSNQRVSAAAQDFNIDFSARFWAQRLADIHFGTGLRSDQPTGNILYIYGFAGVAVFILMIACINYVNLATAQSMKRAKSIGMRKILGAKRFHLVVLYIVESVCLVLLAMLISVIAVYGLSKFEYLSILVEPQFSIDMIRQPEAIISFFLLNVVVGFLSGAYPAFYLSSISPLAALSSVIKNHNSNSARLRRLLVFVQFMLSIGVISSALLMVSQMRYVANLPLGFDKENKLLVPLRGVDVIESMPALRNELLNHPEILQVSMTVNVPGQRVGQRAYRLEDQLGEVSTYLISTMMVGENYLETLGIEIEEGRGLSQRFLTDVDTSMIVNRTFVKEMGWDRPLGKVVLNSSGITIGRVVGVVEDFHFESLHQSVAPLIIVSAPTNFENLSVASAIMQKRTLVVNLSGEDNAQTLRYVRDQMLKFDPSHPFEFSFLDAQLDDQYQSERNILVLTGLFSAICVLISCLGIFGLSSFSTEQRTKEIGIRKVLGASKWQIISMLSKNIVILVLVGAIFGTIGSYFVIRLWLSTFAYAGFVNPLIFAAATLLSMTVTIVTIAAQSYKIASSLPAYTLRHE